MIFFLLDILIFAAFFTFAARQLKRQSFYWAVAYIILATFQAADIIRSIGMFLRALNTTLT